MTIQKSDTSFYYFSRESEVTGNNQSITEMNEIPIVCNPFDDSNLYGDWNFFRKEIKIIGNPWTPVTTLSSWIVLVF